jgi:hypothetical protein
MFSIDSDEAEEEEECRKLVEEASSTLQGDERCCRIVVRIELKEVCELSTRCTSYTLTHCFNPGSPKDPRANLLCQAGEKDVPGPRDNRRT